MSSVNSTNPGVASLIQILTKNASPAVANALSSSKVQTALEKSPTGDLVQLSAEVMQMQSVGMLFGNPDSASTASATSIADQVNATLEAALAKRDAGKTEKTNTSAVDSPEQKVIDTIKALLSDETIGTTSTGTLDQTVRDRIEALFDDTSSKRTSSILDTLG